MLILVNSYVYTLSHINRATFLVPNIFMSQIVLSRFVLFSLQTWLERIHRRWLMCFVLFFSLSKELISVCIEAVSKGLQSLFQDSIQTSQTCWRKTSALHEGQRDLQWDLEFNSTIFACHWASSYRVTIFQSQL